MRLYALKFGPKAGDAKVRNKYYAGVSISGIEYETFAFSAQLDNAEFFTSKKEALAFTEYLSYYDDTDEGILLNVNLIEVERQLLVKSKKRICWNEKGTLPYTTGKYDK